ncbi:MAG: hypothetical protein Q7R85_02485 [bacterium]|nr:hypothetical protein [bacterium]
MVSPEKFTPPEPEKPEKKEEEPMVRVVAQPAGDVRAGKKKEYGMIAYEDEVFSFPKSAMPRYKQFDVDVELQKIRLTRGPRIPEGKSEPENRRSETKERLAEMKEMLVRQKEGVGVAIRALQRMMQADPKADGVKFFKQVLEFAPKYRFSHAQLEGFWKAITAYGKKHSAVEKYRKEFPSDERLFEACFGRAPQGKVEVIKEPMMLYVRCYDDDDYAFAYDFDETGGDETKLTSAMRKQAMQSAGAALGATKIEALNSAVAIERTSTVVTAEHREEESTDHLRALGKGSSESVILKDAATSVAVEVLGVGTFIIEVVERATDGRPSQVILIEERNGKRVVLRTLQYRATRDSDGHGVMLDERGGRHGLIQYVVQGGKGPDAARATISFTYTAARVTNHGKELVAVAYKAHEKSVEIDEKLSAAIRTHEGQHLVNRLFEPLAWKVAETEIMARAARAAKTPDETKQMLMAELARSARSIIGIDNEARDEILAYYKDGSSLKYILEQLTQTSLYAYRDATRYKERIAELPKVIAGSMTKNMSAIIYDTVPAEEAGAPAEEKMSDVVPLLTLASEAKPYVEKAFGAEYDKDVERWIGAIETLEKKGYGRDEIVSVLYGEKVPDWTAFARRALEKGKV